MESFTNLKINLGLLGLRVFFGLSMAFAHGLGKIPPSQRFVEKIGSMGLPLPEIMAWAASLSEFVGGILIAIGLLTRFSAISLAITMFVAAFVAHGADPYTKKELALCFLTVSVFFAAVGPGKFSVDNILNKPSV